MPIMICPACGAKNRLAYPPPKILPPCIRCKAALAVAARRPEKPLILTDATFARQILKPDRHPLLVDCWAPWCGPCRLIGKILDELAAESAGRYTIAKLNIDQCPRTASRYRIETLPTLLIFRAGALVDRLVGTHSKRVIAARLVAAGAVGSTGRHE